MPKLGKKAFTPDPRDLLFANYRTAAPLPPHPKTFGHDAAVKTWGMLANDQYGDCAEAMVTHWFMLLAACTGAAINVTVKSVLELYSAVTNFNPNDPNSDQGTMLRDLLKYLRDTGYKDGSGKIHKIEAFVKVDHTNMNEVEEAMYLFGGVMFGVQLPDSAQQQFQEGKPWSVVRNSPIDGGHAILGGGIGAHKPTGFLEVAMDSFGLSTPDARVVTWGQDIPATQGFLREYLDECWVCLSGDELKDGKSLEGYDIETLKKDLSAL